MQSLRWPRAWLGLWIAAIVIVIALSLVPPPPMPMEPPRDFDKLLHFAAYFSLAFAAIQLFARRRVLVCVAVGLVVLGMLMEWAQGALVPEIRSADPWDALANTVGVLVGMVFVATPLARCLQKLESWLWR